MDIWKILEIEPTKDKRAIKKAYASRAKLVHPEEKPLEFEALYEAYQKALEYAGGGRGMRLRPPVPKGGEPAEHTDGDAGSQEEGMPPKGEGPDSPLYLYFKDVLENQKRLFETLLFQWDAVEREGWKEETQAAWADYLSSEDFKKIQWTSQAVEFLAQKTAASQKRFYWAQGQPFLALWEAYGFREEGCKEELKSLYKGLYPAFAQRKRRWLEAQREIEQELASWRQDRIMKRAALAGAAVLALAAAVWLYLSATAPRRALEGYLRLEYPGTEFSKPVKNEDGGYSFRSKSHPEIEARGQVEKVSDYVITEDYGSRLLALYAAEGGMELDFGYMEEEGMYVLYYPDAEEAEAFCGLLEDILKEEELAFAEKIGFCPKGAVYPRQAVTGGDCGFSEGPVFLPEEPVKMQELAEAVKEAWADYMFNYEPWNLTEEQRKTWEVGYEERAEAARDRGDISLLSIMDAGALEDQPRQVCIPVYERTEYGSMGAGVSLSREVQYITIGNAYRLFEAAGAKITVNKDRSGFTVLDASGQPQSYQGFYATALKNVKAVLNGE